jgi:hypothetical protein
MTTEISPERLMEHSKSEQGAGPVAALAGSERQLSRYSLGLGPLILGLALSGILLHITFASQRTNLEAVALGGENQSVFASFDGFSIHCRDVEEASDCIAGSRSRNRERTALWLGNSQLHAINQFQDGDETAIPWLFRRLSSHGIDLVTLSQPNASLLEHYVLFEYLQGRLDVDFLVLPVVFDDLREAGIRDNISPALTDADTYRALDQPSIGRQILADHQDAAGGDLAGVRETIQERSEGALNDWLNRNLGLWALRPEARGRIFIELYRLRNSAFGISAQSKRRMIIGRYQTNLLALEAILDSASTSGTQVLVYVVPLRTDVEIPYVKEEYEQFKADMAGQVEAKGQTFANLENLVPSELWGAKDSTNLGDATAELDFMHFQAGGHKLLAEALAELLETRLLSSAL